MTYGYESISTFSSNVSGINDIATNLFNRLKVDRRLKQVSIA